MEVFNIITLVFAIMLAILFIKLIIMFIELMLQEPKAICSIVALPYNFAYGGSWDDSSFVGFQ